MGRKDKSSIPLILLVEDDPDISRLTQFVLRDVCDVVTAADGRSGLEMAARIEPDLVLLDIYMAGLSGFDVCRQLKENTGTSHIPVVILTAGAQNHEIAKGYSCGADDYIVKPFDPEDLVTRILKRLPGDQPGN